MLETLAKFLSQSCTPELKDSIERAHALFERIELPDYDSIFEELLLTDGDSGQPDTVTLVVELTRQQQDHILQAHSVQLSDETSLDMRTKFLEALLDLQNYEDFMIIRSTLALDVNNEEVLAELCALVSEHNAAEWLYAIESVDASLLERIRQIAIPQLPEKIGSGMAGPMRAARIDSLVKLSTITKGYTPRVVGFIAEGGDFGYTLDVYALALGSQVTDLAPESMAIELLAMALVSVDGFDSPVASITPYLEGLVHDAELSTKVLVQINQLVLLMQQGPAVTKVPA